MLYKISIIKKLPSGQYRLYSRKKDKSGKRRNLGTFDSLKKAKEREKQVQFFKHHADTPETLDKQTKMLLDLSDIAQYLESAGFIEEADVLYEIMNVVDGVKENNLIDSDLPSIQLNTENSGYIGGDAIGGSYSLLNQSVAQPADDTTSLKQKQKQSLYLEKALVAERWEKYWKHQQNETNEQQARKMKELLLNKALNFESNNTDDQCFQKSLKYKKEDGEEKAIVEWSDTDKKKTKEFDDIEKAKKYYDTLNDIEKEMANIDALVRSNGLDGVTVIDNQNSGSFSGLSDAYFYSQLSNQDHTGKITI